MGKFSVNGDLVVVSHGFIWFKGDFFLVRYLFFFWIIPRLVSVVVETIVTSFMAW